MLTSSLFNPHPKVASTIHDLHILCWQIARIQMYLRRPSYFKRGIKSSSQALSFVLLFALPTCLCFSSLFCCVSIWVMHRQPELLSHCVSRLLFKHWPFFFFLASFNLCLSGLTSTTLNHATQDSAQPFLFPLLNATQITGLRSCGLHLS